MLKHQPNNLNMGEDNSLFETNLERDGYIDREFLRSM